MLPSAAATIANWCTSFPVVFRVRSAEECDPIESAERMLAIGARARDPRILAHPRWSARHEYLRKRIARAVGPEKLVFAIDSKQGRVAIRGWRELTTISPLEMIASSGTLVQRVSLHPHRHRGPNAGNSPRHRQPATSFNQ